MEPLVGECLMAAIGEVLGDAVTPEIAAAWEGVYEELAGLLIELEAHRYREFESRPGGATLAEAHPERLRTVTVHESGAAADHVGRVDRDLLASYLPEGGRCYFVGPQGFMTAVDQALAELGVPSERRHFEHFGPSRPLDAA